MEISFFLIILTIIVIFIIVGMFLLFLYLMVKEDDKEFISRANYFENAYVTTDIKNKSKYSKLPNGAYGHVTSRREK